MSDEQYKIGIDVEKTGSGGAQVIQELDQVKQKVDEVDQTLTRARTPPKIVDTEQFQIYAKSAKEVADVADTSAPKLAAFREAIAGINMAAQGGPGAALGMARAYDGLMKTLGSSGGPAAAIAAAFTIGATAGTIIQKSIVSPVMDALDEIRQAGDGAGAKLKEQLAAAGRVEVHFAGLKKGIDEALKDIDRLKTEMAKIDEAAAAQKRLSDKRSEIAGVKTQISESKDLSAGPQDPAAQAAIKQIYEQKKKQAALEEEATQIAAELNLKQKLLTGFIASRLKLEEKIKALQEEQLAIWQNPDASAKEKLRSKSITREIESSTGNEKAVNELIDPLITAVNELKLSADLNAQKKELTALELGKESQKCLNDLERALRDQADRVNQAKENLATAQRGGNQVEQGQAFNQLSAEEAKLGQLQALMETAKAQIKASGEEFGKGYLDAAQTAKTASAAAVTQLQAHGDDLKKGAEGVVTAVEGATGQIGDSLTRMGGSVDRFGTGIVTAIDRHASQTADKIAAITASLNSRLDAVERTASRADGNSQLALDQVKNRR